MTPLLLIALLLTIVTTQTLSFTVTPPFGLSSTFSHQSALATSSSTTSPSSSSSKLYANPSESNEILKGVVKWFNTQKGFGFITPSTQSSSSSSDIFVHQTSILSSGFRSLADGEEVEFKIIEDSNGRLKAVDVTGPEGREVQGAPFQGGGDGGMGGGGGGGARY